MEPAGNEQGVTRKIIIEVVVYQMPKLTDDVRVRRRHCDEQRRTSSGKLSSEVAAGEWDGATKRVWLKRKSERLRLTSRKSLEIVGHDLESVALLSASTQHSLTPA